MNELIAHYPWLALLGPAVGALVNQLKTTGKLRGYGLLGAATALSAAGCGLYGLAMGWGAADWKAVPLAILLTLGSSSLTGTTLEHAADGEATEEDAPKS